jgi:hypothetical protein
MAHHARLCADQASSGKVACWQGKAAFADWVSYKPHALQASNTPVASILLQYETASRLLLLGVLDPSNAQHRAILEQHGDEGGWAADGGLLIAAVSMLGLHRAILPYCCRALLLALHAWLVHLLALLASFKQAG